MATKRVNIRVTEEMHKWFMSRSEQTGVAMSSLMALALEEHMVQRQTIGILNKIPQENFIEEKK